MIDVSEHIKKLDILKEYLSIKIDDTPTLCWLNIGAMPSYDYSPQYLLSLFFETGIRLINDRVKQEQRIISFEEYLEIKK
jgi:hypothetical protein